MLDRKTIELINKINSSKISKDVYVDYINEISLNEMLIKYNLTEDTCFLMLGAFESKLNKQLGIKSFLNLSSKAKNLLLIEGYTSQNILGETIISSENKDMLRTDVIKNQLYYNGRGISSTHGFGIKTYNEIRLFVGLKEKKSVKPNSIDGLNKLNERINDLQDKIDRIKMLKAKYVIEEQ